MDQRRLALLHLCLRMLTYVTGTVPRTTGLLLIAGSLLFACSWQGPQERMSDATMVRKSESADERSVQDPAAQSLIDDLKKRTAILFTNTDEVVVEVLEGQRRRIKWRSNGTIDISAAVPVAEDGYFLTTAHSVEAPTSLTLVLRQAQIYGYLRVFLAPDSFLARGIPSRSPAEGCLLARDAPSRSPAEGSVPPPCVGPATPRRRASPGTKNPSQLHSHLWT